VRRLKIALAAAMLAAVAVAAPASAITNNYTADFEHPYVGLIAFYDAAGEFQHRCSGSLISPTVMITAGHCTDDGAGGVNASARVWFQQDAGANYDPATEYDPVSGYPDTCLDATLCVTSHEMYNFGFDDFAGFPDTHDVGLVILDQPINLSEYGVLAPVGTLDSLATRRGRNDTIFTVSGYGLSRSNQPQSGIPNVSFRERLMATSTLVNLNSSLNDGFNIQTQGNGNGRGGTCSGDSGGPVFLGDVESNVIVAVTSFGLNGICRGTDFAYRVDTAAVQAWIDSIVGG
jgi:hypothetical protein